MKEKLKEIFNRINFKELLFFFTITLVFFGVFILKDYTSDSYLFFQETWREPFFHLMSLGRVVTAVFWLLFSKTNFETMYMASFIIAIIATTLSIYKFNEILKRYIKSNIITALISILTIINFCTLELFMFYEKGIMMLSILMIVLACGHIEEALKFNKKAILIILLEMFIANCCYQGTVGLFIAFGIIICIVNIKNFWKFVKDNLIVALLYAIPALLNFLMAKFLFNSARLEGGELSLIERIKDICLVTKRSMLTTFDILPKYFFIGLCLIISLIYIISVIKQKEKIKNKILNVALLIYLEVIVVLSAVAPQIMQSYVYLVPRNAFPLGAILPLIMILLFIKVDIKDILKKFIIVCSVILLSIQFYNFMDITKGHYFTNQKDMEIATRISHLVTDYENKSGEKITKVVIYRSGRNVIHYANVRCIGDASVKAYANDWGIRGILDVALKREVQVVEEQNEQFEQKFKLNEYELFSDDQIIFEKDTMHLYVY